MAYNNYSNNKDANKPFEPTVYSPYRMNNGESTIDQTCLTFTYWKSMLKISISPRKNTNNDEMVFDMDNGISVYMNHAKARILATELRNFLNDPHKFNGAGVPSGKAVINISDGKEFGIESPVLVIRKIDENGNVDSSFAYEFKTNYYFSVRGYNGGKDFIKSTEDYMNLEIEEMITLLNSYCEAMTYATAYSVLDQNKYNNDRMTNKLTAIAEKLGIETKTSGGGGRGNYNSSTSFFNNGGTEAATPTASYPTATLDDIE